MPFMKGHAPIRRTYKYLEAGKIVLKDFVRIVSINYNVGIPNDNHSGARHFVFWYMPQLQYKNPNVQFVTFRNLTPTPFIRCFLDSGEQVLMDIDGKEKEEIHDHLKKILGKTDETLAKEAILKEQKTNLANFGEDCLRHCMCEIPGQVPCPGVIRFPNSMRQKFTREAN